MRSSSLSPLFLFASLLFALSSATAADRIWVGSDGKPVRSGTGTCVFALNGTEHPDCSGAIAMMPTDSDGDGIVDTKDQCSETPSGTAVDAVGCPRVMDGDSDNDGVRDSRDRCPGTASGVAVNGSGCALPVDSDGDGVVDNSDKCPGTMTGADVDAQGCTQKLVLNSLTFETNSAILTPGAKTILDSVATSLQRAPTVRHTTITGHTDGSGAASYNKMLSEKRASAVRDYLISRGIRADKLSAKGAGEEQPIADNATREGRLQNRRVEFTIAQ